MATPDVLLKVRRLIGSSTPGRLLWSAQLAENCPIPGAPPMGTGEPVWLSVTGTYEPNDVGSAGSCRKRDGSLPLFGPALAVATSLPAAFLSDARELTAL